MILDTSFLIDVMNGDAAALETVDEIEAAEVPQRIPAMTLQELYIGVGMSELPEQERREIERIIEARPVVPTSAAIARKAGRIDGELRAAGEPIDIGDATIGATAVVCDEPVVTGNPDHFERISGIEVVSY
jgi:predicted nucleic acid-binding protein